MTKDYDLYEPYRDWDPFIERDDDQKESDKRKQKKNQKD